MLKYLLSLLVGIDLLQGAGYAPHPVHYPELTHNVFWAWHEFVYEGWGSISVL